MDLRTGFCSLVLLTAVSAQPVLAAEAQVAKPAPVAQTLQLADVPMKGMFAEDSSASVTQTTRRDDVGFDIDELLSPKATCPPAGNATFTWTIIDGCGDGQGLFVRFFDETNNIIFPNSSQVYSINSAHTGVVKLSAKRGAKICYGAEPTNRNGHFWGVGLDNDQSCASCCTIVPNTGNISRSVRLICS
jgi:hypothetical protein